GEWQRDVVVADQAAGLGRGRLDRRDHALHRDRLPGQVVDAGAVVAGNGGQHRAGRRRGQALVAAWAVDCVWSQADAGHTTLLVVDPGAALVGSFVNT